MGALLLSWKHPDLQFLVGFLVVVVENWDLQFLVGLVLLCKNSGLCNLGRIVVVVVEILGLAIWSDCCLVGLKTHFQNLKLFFLLPSYKVLEE